MQTHLNEIGKLNYPMQVPGGFIVEPKESTSKKHFYFSIFKSLMRIVGFLFLCCNMLVIAGLILVFAEFLGILEEF